MRFLIFVLIVILTNQTLFAAEKETVTSGTKVVLLGTGNPNPDPRHSGCSVAIIANNTAYVVDFGPGLVRKAAELSTSFSGPIKALNVDNLKTGFLTHLHSDHTVGLADFILTPWVIGRDSPLKLFGPPGTREMIDHLLAAYRADIDYRVYGSEPANDQGWRVEVTEFSEGRIYTDANITAEAFPVVHGSWPNAFGFRFTTADKVIVISGDTAPCENIVKFARGADILIHEVYSQQGYEKRNALWKAYHAHHHTSTIELGRIASRAGPGLLVLYHILFWGAEEQDLLDEIGTVYQGRVRVGRDLDVIE